MNGISGSISAVERFRVFHERKNDYFIVLKRCLGVSFRESAKAAKSLGSGVQSEGSKCSSTEAIKLL
jgi:hypothetical protein